MSSWQGITLAVLLKNWSLSMLIGYDVFECVRLAREGDMQNLFKRVDGGSKVDTNRKSPSAGGEGV